jgi:xanthine dehydrogenase/oxidase
LIDVGQAEGGFMMGLGFIMLEKTVYDPVTGKCLNNGTWDYKPPMIKDLPIDLRISFLENKPNPIGVLGSKAIGEPPLLLSNSILLAIKQAIAASRKESDVHGNFPLAVPALPDVIQQACLIEPISLKLIS